MYVAKSSTHDHSHVLAVVNAYMRIGLIDGLHTGPIVDAGRDASIRDSLPSRSLKLDRPVLDVE